MLTVEKLQKIAQESFETNEWICVQCGESFIIVKLNSQKEVDTFIHGLSDDIDEDEAVVFDPETDCYYKDAATAKDWNYFKNTMLV